MTRAPRPRVYLVGAGPGDPGLLTRRGAAVLQKAGVVFYDSLTHPALLDLAPAGAERIYVGKPAGDKTITQESINAQLVERARGGATVVRLKGGDSFVFGRGGEEALALLQAGIPFEVVPGLTSAVAAPALAGIPVTHRGVNSVVHVVTGHEDPMSAECSVPWKLLADSRQTIVVLMGTARMEAICQRLFSDGLPSETPVAVVYHGSYPAQKTLRATLGEAVADITKVKLPSPSVIVIGAVAGMDERLNVFEKRPLSGRRIVLTRPETRRGTMLEALRESGAEAENIPVIRFEGCGGQSSKELVRRLEELRSGSGWLILPSPAAVRFLFELLGAENFDARALAGIRVAVVGAGSADELSNRGLKADFVSEAGTGEALASKLPLGSGEPVLIAGSSQSRPELADGLRARGGAVGNLALYSTVPHAEGIKTLNAKIADGELDSVVVFSPSAVEAIFSRAEGSALAALRGVRWYAIGPTTAEALRGIGVVPAGIAERPNAESLLDAVIGGSEAR